MSKRLQLEGEIRGIRMRKRMRNNLIETCKVINGISNYSSHFLILHLELEIFWPGRFQISILIRFFFVVVFDRVTYFWNKLTN